MQNSFFTRTFAKAAVVIYCLGTIFHLVRLIVKFEVDDIPFLADLVILVLAGYAGVGYIMHFKRIDFKSAADKLLYSLVLLHLNLSAVIHLYTFVARDHEWIKLFPMGYSYFAVAYFLGFAFYSYRIDRRIRIFFRGGTERLSAPGSEQNSPIIK